MNPYTQPMTEQQRAEQRQLSELVTDVEWCNLYIPYTSALFANEPAIDLVAIDWLEINREFS